MTSAVAVAILHRASDRRFLNDEHWVAKTCAAANGGIALLFQSTRLVAAYIGSLAGIAHESSDFNQSQETRMGHGVGRGGRPLCGRMVRLYRIHDGGAQDG